MKKFVIIGLGSFGVRMLDELLKLTDGVIIIDENSDLIEKYKDKAHNAYCPEELNEMVLQKLIPSNTEAVIIDLVEKIEKSIMVTSFLKKLNVNNIIVKAKSDEHGTILSKMGADRIIFPDREAAKRTMPILASSLLFKFLPISQNMALAEVAVSAKYVGKNLIEADLRKELGVNIVGIRKKNEETFTFVDNPNYIFQKDDVLLIVASEEHIFQFSDDRNLFQKAVKPSVFKNIF